MVVFKSPISTKGYFCAAAYSAIPCNCRFLKENPMERTGGGGWVASNERSLFFKRTVAAMLGSGEPPKNSTLADSKGYLL